MPGTTQTFAASFCKAAGRSEGTPGGNRLEALKGDRKGQWSIRINDQWRVCFHWSDAAAQDVEIVDYHR
jgi:plasmid maintenance system killer protein